VLIIITHLFQQKQQPEAATQQKDENNCIDSDFRLYWPINRFR